MDGSSRGHARSSAVVSSGVPSGHCRMTVTGAPAREPVNRLSAYVSPSGPVSASQLVMVNRPNYAHRLEHESCKQRLRPDTLRSLRWTGRRACLASKCRCRRRPGRLGLRFLMARTGSGRARQTVKTGASRPQAVAEGRKRRRESAGEDGHQRVQLACFHCRSKRIRCSGTKPVCEVGHA